MSTAADRVPYHHGDLRNALITTATELARAGGPAAVHLRETARRVGVSPSAAYRHFTDQADLLSAVATNVLDELAARMRAAVAAVPDTGSPGLDALERFRAVGVAYIDYAWGQPGLFRTAYASGVDLPGLDLPGVTGTDGDGGSAPTGNPYRILGDALDELAAAGVLPRARRRHAEVAAWSGVHGVSMLVLDGALRGVAEDPQELVDVTLDMIGIGLCAPASALGDLAAGAADG